MGSPRFPLTGYIDLVKSSSCSWLTSLSVWTEYARVPELVKLADVANLVSLEINTPPATSSMMMMTADGEESLSELATLNDRILRTWGELAETETSGAFRHLRVLKLYSQRDLTAQSFVYLCKLPCLEYCVLARCDGLTRKSALRMAHSQGWMIVCTKEEEDDNDTTNCPTMCQFSTTSGTSKTFNDCLPDTLLTPRALPKNTPLLEFSVGQRREKVKDRDVIVLRRKLGGPEAHKRTIADAAGVYDGAQKRARKPVMKPRGRDISGMLAEFM